MSDAETAAEIPIRQVMAGPIGGKSRFRLFVEGPYTVREVDLLIRFLEVTKSALKEPANVE